MLVGESVICFGDAPQLNMKSTAEFNYRRKKNGNQIDLYEVSSGVLVQLDGKKMTEGRFDRDSIYFKDKDRELRQNTTKMNENKRKMYLERFAEPFFTILIDENGKEMSRTPSSKPSAKIDVESNMVENCQLFHPCFPANDNEWEEKKAISGGGGPPCKGILKYKKNEAPEPNKDQVKVIVHGEMQTPDVQFSKELFMKLTYKIEGEQIYGKNLKSYVSGEMKVNVSTQVCEQSTIKGSANGNIKVTMNMENIEHKTDLQSPDKKP